LAWLGLAIVMLLITGIAGAVSRYAALLATDELEVSTSKLILDQAAQLDLEFYEDADNQDILSRATRKPGSNCLSFLQRFIRICSSAFQLVALLGVLLYIEPWLTWLLALVGVPYLLFQSWLTDARYVIDRSKTRVRRWGNYYRSRLLSPRAVASTRLLGLAPLLYRRYESSVRDVLFAMQKTYRIELIGGIVIMVAFLATFSLTVGVQGWRVLEETMVVGEFVAYWMAAWKFRESLGGLVGSLSGQLQSSLTVGYLIEFLQVKPKIQNSGTTVPADCAGEIVFEDVTFRYPGCDWAALKDVNLRIAPGEVVALVGPNGAGKSTLVKLIARLYDVSEGAVRVDGTDVRELDSGFLHKHLTYAFQKVVRFEATVADNLAFGDWENLIDNPEGIRAVAEKTGTDALIDSLPQGYDTMLGRVFGEHQLSGGQWRRLSIARSLARPASIVVMDEPMASLDIYTELALYTQVRELVKGRTTILISHRLAAVNLADRVFYIDEGRIVESGSHQELVTNNGPYANLWRKYIESTSSLAAPPPEDP